MDDRRLQQQDQQGDAESDQGRLQQQGAEFRGVILSAGLGRQAGRAHAQKAHAPVEKIKDDAADGDPAQINRAIQTPDHGRIDEAQQRHAEIADHHRPGQQPEGAAGVIFAHLNGAGWLYSGRRGRVAALPGRRGNQAGDRAAFRITSHPGGEREQNRGSFKDKARPRRR